MQSKYTRSEILPEFSISTIRFSIKSIHLYFIRIITEEIVTKRLRNAQKKVGVNWFLPEYIIHIRPGAIYLAGKPCRSALLATHLIFYYLTNVYHKRRNCLLQIFNWGTAKHLDTDKHKQFTPRGYELSSCLLPCLCKLAVFSWGNRAKSSKNLLFIGIKTFLQIFFANV